MDIFDIEVTTIDGERQKMETYRGKTLLVQPVRFYAAIRGAAVAL